MTHPHARFIGKIILAAGWVLCLTAGCTKKTYNDYTAEFGAIAGRVSPSDTTVRVFVAEGSTEIKPGLQGYFMITELPSGIYTLNVKSRDYTTRLVHGIQVLAGSTANLGKIELSTLPYPFYSVTPPDGSEDVRSGTEVSVALSEPVDVGELLNATHITPPFDFQYFGTYEGWNFGSWEYVLIPTRLAVGTSYQIAIDKGLTTEWGTRLAEDILIRFTTEPLRAEIRMPYADDWGETSLRNFYVVVTFNDFVLIDSFLTASSFVPPIDGDWQSAGTDSLITKSLQFHPGAGFPEGSTDYRFLISGDVRLTPTEARLPGDVFAIFHTEPCGILQVYPRNGQNVYPAATASVQVDFNSPVDTASAEASFTAEMLQGSVLNGSFQWEPSHLGMLFRLEETLITQRSYRITIHKGMLFKNGAVLEEDFVSEFSTY